MTDPTPAPRTRQQLCEETLVVLHAVWEQHCAGLPPEHLDWAIGAAYVRESGATSMTGDAPASQLSRTLGMLALMQVHVPWEGVFFDQRTGTEFATRGEFQRLLEHCWLGHFAVVGALISERLFRNANDAEQTRAEFRRHGIRLEYGNKPHGDERDPSTWKALKDQDTQDEYYARRTSWHIGTTKEYLSRQGRPQGRLPEGYKVKDRGPSFMGQAGRIVSYERNEPLAGIIADGAKRYRQDGSSFQALATWSTTTALEGRTPSGKPMTAWWWRSTLLNPKYAGFHMPSEYAGYKAGKKGSSSPKRRRRTPTTPLIPCILPPLWSLGDHKEMAALSASRKFAEKRRVGYRKSLLSAIAVDERCGHSLSVHSRKADRLYMRCGVQSTAGFDNGPIRCESIEAQVDSLFERLVLDDPTLDGMVQRELVRLREEDAKLPVARANPEVARLRQAAAAIAAITPEIADELRVRIVALEAVDDARRVERDASVRDFNVATRRLRDWHAAWPDASVERKNEVLRAAGVQVTIGRRDGVPAITALKIGHPMIALAVGLALDVAPLGLQRPHGFGPFDPNVLELDAHAANVLARVRAMRASAA
jgi:hypothetical protein